MKRKSKKENFIKIIDVDKKIVDNLKKVKKEKTIEDLNEATLCSLNTDFSLITTMLSLKENEPLKELKKSLDSKIKLFSSETSIYNSEMDTLTMSDNLTIGIIILNTLKNDAKKQQKDFETFGNFLNSVKNNIDHKLILLLCRSILDTGFNNISANDIQSSALKFLIENVNFDQYLLFRVIYISYFKDMLLSNPVWSNDENYYFIVEIALSVCKTKFSHNMTSYLVDNNYINNVDLTRFNLECGDVELFCMNILENYFLQNKSVASYSEHFIRFIIYFVSFPSIRHLISSKIDLICGVCDSSQQLILTLLMDTIAVNCVDISQVNQNVIFNLLYNSYKSKNIASNIMLKFSNHVSTFIGSDKSNLIYIIRGTILKKLISAGCNEHGVKFNVPHNKVFSNALVNQSIRELFKSYPIDISYIFGFAYRSILIESICHVDPNTKNFLKCRTYEESINVKVKNLDSLLHFLKISLKEFKRKFNFNQSNLLYLICGLLDTCNFKTNMVYHSESFSNYSMNVINDFNFENKKILITAMLDMTVFSIFCITSLYEMYNNESGQHLFEVYNNIINMVLKDSKRCMKPFNGSQDYTFLMDSYKKTFFYKTEQEYTISDTHLNETVHRKVLRYILKYCFLNSRNLKKFSKLQILFQYDPVNLNLNHFICTRFIDVYLCTFYRFHESNNDCFFSNVNQLKSFIIHILKSLSECHYFNSDYNLDIFWKYMLIFSLFTIIDSSISPITFQLVLVGCILKYFLTGNYNAAFKDSIHVDFKNIGSCDENGDDFSFVNYYPAGFVNFIPPSNVYAEMQQIGAKLKISILISSKATLIEEFLKDNTILEVMPTSRVKCHVIRDLSTKTFAKFLMASYNQNVYLKCRLFSSDILTDKLHSNLLVEHLDLLESWFNSTIFDHLNNFNTEIEPQDLIYANRKLKMIILLLFEFICSADCGNFREIAYHCLCDFLHIIFIKLLKLNKFESMPKLAECYENYFSQTVIIEECKMIKIETCSIPSCSKQILLLLYFDIYNLDSEIFNFDKISNIESYIKQIFNLIENETKFEIFLSFLILLLKLINLLVCQQNYQCIPKLCDILVNKHAVQFLIFWNNLNEVKTKLSVFKCVFSLDEIFVVFNSFIENIFKILTSFLTFCEFDNLEMPYLMIKIDGKDSIVPVSVFKLLIFLLSTQPFDDNLHCFNELFYTCSSLEKFKIVVKESDSHILSDDYNLLQALLGVDPESIYYKAISSFALLNLSLDSALKILNSFSVSRNCLGTLFQYLDGIVENDSHDLLMNYVSNDKNWFNFVDMLNMHLTDLHGSFDASNENKIVGFKFLHHLKQLNGQYIESPQPSFDSDECVSLLDHTLLMTSDFFKCFSNITVKDDLNQFGLLEYKIINSLYGMNLHEATEMFTHLYRFVNEFMRGSEMKSVQRSNDKLIFKIDYVFIKTLSSIYEYELITVIDEFREFIGKFKKPIAQVIEIDSEENETESNGQVHLEQILMVKFDMHSFSQRLIEISKDFKIKIHSDIISFINLNKYSDNLQSVLINYFTNSEAKEKCCYRNFLQFLSRIVFDSNSNILEEFLIKNDVMLGIVKFIFENSFIDDSMIVLFFEAFFFNSEVCANNISSVILVLNELYQFSMNSRNRVKAILKNIVETMLNILDKKDLEYKKVNIAPYKVNVLIEISNDLPEKSFESYVKLLQSIFSNVDLRQISYSINLSEKMKTFLFYWSMSNPNDYMDAENMLTKKTFTTNIQSKLDTDIIMLLRESIDPIKFIELYDSSEKNVFNQTNNLEKHLAISKFYISFVIGRHPLYLLRQFPTIQCLMCGIWEYSLDQIISNKFLQICIHLLKSLNAINPKIYKHVPFHTHLSQFIATFMNLFEVNLKATHTVFLEFKRQFFFFIRLIFKFGHSFKIYKFFNDRIELSKKICESGDYRLILLISKDMKKIKYENIDIISFNLLENDYCFKPCDLDKIDLEGIDDLNYFTIFKKISEVKKNKVQSEQFHLDQLHSNLCQYLACDNHFISNAAFTFIIDSFHQSKTIKDFTFYFLRNLLEKYKVMANFTDLLAKIKTLFVRNVDYFDQLPILCFESFSNYNYDISHQFIDFIENRSTDFVKNIPAL